MRKRQVLLSVALGAACLAGSAAASDKQAPAQPAKAKYSGVDPLKGQGIKKVATNSSTTASTSETPVWPPDNSKVKCGGINACVGKGSCQGATNSCAGKNGCKGKGWLETTAQDCKDKKGTVLVSTTDGKGSKK